MVVALVHSIRLLLLVLESSVEDVTLLLRADATMLSTRSWQNTILSLHSNTIIHYLLTQEHDSKKAATK
jgi:hypothetical protein